MWRDRFLFNSNGGDLRGLMIPVRINLGYLGDVMILVFLLELGCVAIPKGGYGYIGFLKRYTNLIIKSGKYTRSVHHTYGNTHA